MKIQKKDKERLVIVSNCCLFVQAIKFQKLIFLWFVFEALNQIFFEFQMYNPRKKTKNSFQTVAPFAASSKVANTIARTLICFDFFFERQFGLLMSNCRSPDVISKEETNGQKFTSLWIRSELHKHLTKFEILQGPLQNPNDLNTNVACMLMWDETDEVFYQDI